MKTTFSPYLNDKRPIMKTLINRLNKHYPFVSILGTDVNAISYDLDKSSANISSTDESESGFVIKVYDGEFYTEYATDLLDDDHLDDVISSINGLVKTPRALKTMPAKMVKEEAHKEDFVRELEGENLSSKAIMDALKRIQTKTLSFHEHVLNVRCGLSITLTHKLYISTKKELSQVYPWVNYKTFSLSKHGDNTKYAFDGNGTLSIEQALTELKSMAKNTADIAVKLLEAKPPKPGTYTVITDPSITGLIAHEAFGHGVEMDMFVKDRAEAKYHIDKPVASEIVNMHDGAASALSVASYFFDDDGVLAHDTKIIENGILRRGISDLLSAMQLGTTPTGNGRRQSFKRKSYSRMTNTYFAKGDDTLDDMIKSVEHGYLIVQTNNGMEDPKNWGIQCTAHYGREIKHGAFTGKLVSPVVLSGHVIDVLTSINAISEDFKIIGSGFCGKGYKEWVPVSDGGPYLKCEVKIG